MTYRIRLPTPLECQDETDYARDQKCSAEEVQLYQLLSPRDTGSILLGNLEAKGDEDHRGATDWQVD